MPIDLNQLVNDTYAQYQREETDAKQETARKTVEAQQAAISAFEARLVAELGQEFVDALGVAYTVRSDGGKWVAFGNWKDQPSETEWVIALDARPRGETVWNISAYEVGWGRNTMFTHSASVGNTRNAILIGLGQVRDKMADKRAERQREEQQEAVRREQRQREFEAAQQERAERERIHNEIAAKIEQAKQDALASAWKWADGVTITYYVLSYCIGAIGNGEGGAEVEIVKAYTLTDQLDERGYITTYSGSYWGAQVRYIDAIRLDMNAHKPVWTRKTASSVEDLPFDFREHVFTYVPGVSRCEGFFAYDDDERTEVVVLRDGQPLSWLRERVDEAAQ